MKGGFNVSVLSPIEYFLHSANSHQEALEQTLVALQMDLDKDVKYFASVHPGSTRINEDAMSTTSSTYWTRTYTTPSLDNGLGAWTGLYHGHKN